MDCLVDAALDNHDWSNEPVIYKHVVPMKATSRHLLHADTNEVLAPAMPGYKWLWRHGHPHIVPEDWDLDKILSEVETRKGKKF